MAKVILFVAQKSLVYKNKILVVRVKTPNMPIVIIIIIRVDGKSFAMYEKIQHTLENNTPNGIL
jgi:hypothetical protein